jgi:serine/threonine-protein kinase
MPASGKAGRKGQPATVMTKATPSSSRAGYAGYDEEEDDLPVRKGGIRWLTALNLFLLLVVLASGAGLFVVVSNTLKPYEEVIVPQLVGKTLTEAKALSAEKHFTLSVVDEQFRENEAAGVIYQMGTTPGRRIKEGKAIPIWVSKGPRMVEIPNVVDMGFERARSLLENKGLRLGDVKGEYDQLIAKANVLQQTPVAGENRARGTMVDLVISKGPEPEPTPAPFDYSTPAPIEDPAATPDPNATPEAGSSPSARVRYFDVKYPVPSEGDEHRIRIDVLDDNGPRTVFDEVRKSGAKVNFRVEAVGKAISIKVYDNDELKYEQQAPKE